MYLSFYTSWKSSFEWKFYEANFRGGLGGQVWLGAITRNVILVMNILKTSFGFFDKYV